MSTERLACDIARDLRTRGPWPSEKLLIEAADKMEGLIELLAKSETELGQARADLDDVIAERDKLTEKFLAELDQARAEVARLRAGNDQLIGELENSDKIIAELDGETAHLRTDLAEIKATVLGVDEAVADARLENQLRSEACDD